MKMLSKEEAMKHLENEAAKLDQAAGLPGMYSADDVIRLIATLDKRQKEQGNLSIVDAYLSATKEPEQYQA